jgi:hypothetical protein
MTDPNQFSQTPELQPDFSIMESFRNSRFGRIVTAGVASLTLASGVEAGALAFADPVAADNAPARSANPEAQASYTPTRPCASTDSISPKPQWRASYSFNTPNGKEHVNSIRPGGLTRFVAQVAGGNVEAFSLYGYYDGDKSIEILKRGSHPAWTPTGGRPHWAIKELCHWKDKRNISFLIKVDNSARTNSSVCFSTNNLATTAIEKSVPGKLTPHCLKVK